MKHVSLLIGSDKQKDKREKLAELKNVPDGENVVVVATGKYIGEGFDSPWLDTLLLALPISWNGIPLSTKVLCGMTAWIFLLLVEKIQMYFGSKTGYGRRVLSLSGNAE